MHGIAGALRTAAQRLRALKVSGRVAVIFAIGVFVGLSSKAMAGVQYDYIGTNYIDVAGEFTTSQHVSGDIVFDAPLPPSQVLTPTSPDAPKIDSYTFTDGLDTISSTDSGTLTINGPTIITGAAGQIVSMNFGVKEANDPSLIGIDITPGGSAGGYANAHGMAPNIGAGESFTSGTWSLNTAPASGSPTSPQCVSLLKGAVASPMLSGNTAANNLGLSYPEISTSFTPNFGTTLQQAQMACGVTNFNWLQTVTRLPDPSPYYENNPPGQPIHLTSSSVPFSDPPPGSYINKNFWNSFPYYYDANSEGHEWSLRTHESDTSLSFFDDPSDGCLKDGPLNLFSPSQVWESDLPIKGPDGPSTVRALCNNTTAPLLSSLAFTTYLGGVSAEDGLPVNFHIGFAWTDNYNGTVGGAITLASYLPVDPDSGTGGIIITDFFGIAETNIAEPPTARILGVGVLLLVIVRLTRPLVNRHRYR